MASSTNAGSIYTTVRADTKPLDRGLARAKQSLLGFSKWQINLAKGFVAGNIVTSSIRGIVGFVKGAMNANEEIKKMREYFPGIGAAIANFLISPMERFAKSVNAAFDKVKLNEKNVFGIGTLKEYEDVLNNTVLATKKKLEYQQQLQELYKFEEETKLFRMNLVPQGGRRMTMDEKREDVLAQVLLEAKKIEFAIRWSQNKLETYNNLIDKIKVINDWFPKGTAGYIEKPQIMTSNDPLGMMSGMKKYFLEWFKPALGNVYRYQEEMKSRMGVFRSGDEPWKEAVTNSLRGGRDDKLVTNSDRIAKAVESLDGKWKVGSVNEGLQ